MKQTRVVLRIPFWTTKAFDLIRKELEMILEWDMLLATIPEFPMVRRMTLGVNSPMLVPSAQAREVVHAWLGPPVYWIICSYILLQK